MAIFNKSSVTSAAVSTETTVISSGARIEGQFYFDSILHLDGEISGTINSQSIVVIGKSGALKGQLNADKVVVNGIFEGELEANSLEILAGGIVSGNVVVREISIENGGKFNGNSKIKDDVPLIENANVVNE
ncbi:polymer-forming cytoskeletal protein [Campylobacter sp. US33a]|uniref:Polymer-forming cytoskeletal protein n=1 Tax=Campylobacter sp. CCS1377 TaxID=3158229 RepID=A0AAU7E9Q5_9BACT|nr:polymer-forming cytoskeletal protein [Campylobacter sp. US33a]MCW1359751.1 polymer-forming cytoskeletal protein [Campylobacter jejuni]TEY04584.1 polymer-forming cytoskeletal family protein [Campylobacter sp. US33a]